jgi:predicted dehydrogenase
MIRYAVVGAGWISQEAFMPAVAATGNSRMQAIVSGSPETARQLALLQSFCPMGVTALLC